MNSPSASFSGPPATNRSAGSLLLALALVAGMHATGHATRLPVVLDGSFEEWGATPPAWTDPSGDGGSSGIDLGRVWIADDANYLYLRFEAGPDILLNGGNNLEIDVDTDHNGISGLQINGIGADLVWKPGQKTGTFYYQGLPSTIQWDDCGFIGLPTVSNTAFEIAFRRNALPDGSHPLFPPAPGATIRVFLRDSGASGDWLPNSGSVLNYQLDQGSPIVETPVPLARQFAADLRFLTWNVLQDGPWNAALQPKFQRQVQAIAPDVISFQEIYNHSPEVTRQLIASWLPGTWYAAGNNDCITVSRYPVLSTWALDGNLAVYLNTESAIGKRTLLINVHLPCCTDDLGRQHEIDRILSFLRDAVTPGGVLDLQSGALIVFNGDTNLVGSGALRTSLLTGNITDNGTFGPDFAPDWDGTALADVVSRQTEQRLCYTWRSDTSPFWPGRLDYIVYNDSSVLPGNHFVLDPSQMSADSLSAHGLLATDAGASDHMPHCVDLRGDPLGGGCPDGYCPVEVGGQGLRCSLMPNPSTNRARLGLAIERPTTLRLSVFDATGRRLAEPFGDAQEYQPGSWTLQWDGRTGDGKPLPPGVYFVQLAGRDDAGPALRTVRWVVIR